MRPLRSTMNRITRTYRRSNGSYTALNPRKNQFFFAFGSRALSHNAHCVGFNVNALIALINAVAAITSANCRYICPVIPGMNAGGKNTDISTSVIPMIGPISSFIASIDPCFGVCPRSTCCATPSTTTIASSTTIPIARTTANNVNRLIENPSTAIAANAPMIVTGTVVAGTNVARQSCRNTTITTSTNSPASNNVWYTSVDRLPHKRRRVERNLVLQSLRKVFRQLLHRRAHAGRRVQGVGVGQLEDRDAAGDVAVHLEELAVRLRAELDAADVAEPRDLRRPRPVLTMICSNCSARDRLPGTSIVS